MTNQLLLTRVRELERQDNTVRAWAIKRGAWLPSHAELLRKDTR